MPARRTFLVGAISGAVVGAVAALVLLDRVLRFDSQTVATGVTLFATIATMVATLALAWFGWVQIQLERSKREHEERAATQRARAIARLARRSLVEMVNEGHGILLASWISAIGSSKALDPVQAFLRELVDETAPLAGDLASAAERALAAFLLAADRINGLRAQVLPTGVFGATPVARQGQIVGFLIAAVDALLSIAPAAPDERAVKPEVKAMAESIERFFGPLLDER